MSAVEEAKLETEMSSDDYDPSGPKYMGCLDSYYIKHLRDSWLLEDKCPKQNNKAL